MRWGIKVAVALALVLCAMPASALAAPPANDDFADAQILSGPLPIAETGTNLEATKETGEPTPAMGFSGTGHTVWYEWEATVSGFVTVGTCDSNFETTLGVYTGSSVDALTEVAGDFASLGPDCPESSKAAVTFDAVSGTTYKIVVDGYEGGIFPSEPFGQGNIALEIAQTPKPPNDDFAKATVLTGEKLWNGVYAAGDSGFTWNATKESGEPAHAGNQGGASVWYSWTAPFSATFHVSGCGRFEDPLLAAYTGDAVDALTPVAADDSSCSNLQFAATAGTTYHLAIDGKFDTASGKPQMGSVWINLYWDPFESLPPYEEGKDVLPAPHPRPDTFIRKKSLNPKQHRATFTFASSEAGSRFRCKLDSGKFGGCRSPKIYKHLRPGRHVFSVVAISSQGAFDKSPARIRFKMPKPEVG
jgi:hypothetical protein